METFKNFVQLGFNCFIIPLFVNANYKASVISINRKSKNFGAIYDVINENYNSIVANVPACGTPYKFL